MARTLQKQVSKFYPTNVGENIEVIETTRVNVLDYIDQIVEGIENNYDCSDMFGTILYKDGTYDFINESDYDGHKIKRINIQSAMYDDGYAAYVFGKYEVNEYGSVTLL